MLNRRSAYACLSPALYLLNAAGTTITAIPNLNPATDGADLQASAAPTQVATAPNGVTFSQIS